MTAVVAAIASSAPKSPAGMPPTGVPGGNSNNTLITSHGDFMCSLLQRLSATQNYDPKHAIAVSLRASNATVDPSTGKAAVAVVRWTYDVTAAAGKCVAVVGNECWTCPVSNTAIDAEHTHTYTYTKVVNNSSSVCVKGSAPTGGDTTDAAPVNTGWYVQSNDRQTTTLSTAISLPGKSRDGGTGEGDTLSLSLHLHLGVGDFLSEVGPMAVPMMERWLTGSMQSEASPSSIFGLVVLDAKQGNMIAYTSHWQNTSGTDFVNVDDETFIGISDVAQRAYVRIY